MRFKPLVLAGILAAILFFVTNMTSVRNVEVTPIVVTEVVEPNTPPLTVIPVSRMLLRRTSPIKDFRHKSTVLQRLTLSTSQHTSADLAELVSVYRSWREAGNTATSQLFLLSVEGERNSEASSFESVMEESFLQTPSTCPGIGFSRVFAAPEIDLHAPGTSCKLVHNQQMKENGAMPNHAFRTPEPVLRGLPLVLSADLLRFIDRVFGDILLVKRNTTQSSGKEEDRRATKLPPYRRIEEDLMPQPILAACGIGSIDLAEPLYGLRLRLRRWGSSPPSTSLKRLSLAECLPLLFSGRDMHRFTLRLLAERTREELSACASSRMPALLYDARDEYPFSLMNREDSSAEDLASLYFRLASSDEGSVGYPNVVLDRDFLRFARSEEDAASLLRRRASAQQRAATSGIIAALYIPLVVTNFAARDLIRCFYLSLPASIRQSIPLHFTLGAQRFVNTSRNVESHSAAPRANHRSSSHPLFRRYEANVVRYWDASLWHRLARENRSFPISTTTGGGDLLLFDVPDHDDRTLSAMLMKVLLGMVHMTVKYPTAAYYLRGADDAHHVLPRMHLDLTRVLQRQNDPVDMTAFEEISVDNAKELKDRRNDLGRQGQWVRRRFMADGHVTQRLMIKRCRTGETNLPIRWDPRWSGQKFCRPSRNIGPVAYPFYVTGGGGVYSDDVTTRLAVSLPLLPPLYFLEEDVNLGRLTAPLAAPFDTTRIHNFFNATVHVDYVSKGRLPRAFEYCWSNDWIVHKHPRDTLARVDEATHQIECNLGKWEASRRAAAEGTSSSESGLASKCYATTVARWGPLKVPVEANPLKFNPTLYSASNVAPRGPNRWDGNGFERGGTECRDAERIVKSFVGRTECDNN